MGGPEATNCTNRSYVMYLAGMAAGAVVGSYMSGEPITSVAFAMNGALGATVGLVAASMANRASWEIVAATIAVPSLVNGRVDSETVAIGAAVWASSRFFGPCN